MKKRKKYWKIVKYYLFRWLFWYVRSELNERLNKLLFLDSTIFGDLKVKVKSNIIKWHILLMTSVLNVN